MTFSIITEVLFCLRLTTEKLRMRDMIYYDLPYFVNNVVK